MHLNRQPLVSIIIPCFNRERLVSRAIDSALAQTSVRKEIIVIDDGSTDGSWDEIRSYGEKIKAIRTRNRGVSAARNTGLKVASGELLVFLDSDDLLTENAIFWLTTFREKYVAASDASRIIVLGKCQVIDSAGAIINKEVYEIPDRINYKPISCTAIVSSWASNCASLYPAELVKSVGGYNEKLSLGEDLDLNSRLAKGGGIFLPVDRYTYQVRVHEGARITNRRSRQSYESALTAFEAAWERHRADFALSQNTKDKIRLAKWIWSMGRGAYQQGENGLGNEYIRLAHQIAGKKAWNASLALRVLYHFCEPSFVEQVGSMVKGTRATIAALVLATKNVPR